MSSSAIGLRQVLPVHTNSTITPANRRNVPSPTTPSRRTSNLLFVTRTTDDGWHCRIDGPAELERTGDMRTDVTTLTRDLAERLERAIAAKPTDWHMFQPGWGDGGARGGSSPQPLATLPT